MLSQKNKPREYYLDLLRVFAIFAVLVIHCIASSTSASHASSTKAWLFSITLDSFVHWCVPVFVMISGALLINARVYKNSKQHIKKRFVRLLPALLAWPFLYGLWRAFLYDQPVDLLKIIKGYLTGSPTMGPHLYFLFLIAGLYLLTPIISAYVKLVSRKQLWVTTLAIMGATTLWYTLATLLTGKEPALNVITQSLPYVGYFMLGYLFKDIVIRRPWVPVVIFILASSLVTIGIYFTQRLYHSNFFYSYPTIFLMIASPAAFLSGKVIYNKVTELFSNNKRRISTLRSLTVQLSNSAFGVYLVHMIVLDVFIAMFDFNRHSLKHSLLLIPLVTITSWCLVFVVLHIPYARSLVK